MTGGRYGRINQEQLTDILITDANVHHQVSQSQHGGYENTSRTNVAVHRRFNYCDSLNHDVIGVIEQ